MVKDTRNLWKMNVEVAGAIYPATVVKANGAYEVGVCVCVCVCAVLCVCVCLPVCARLLVCIYVSVRVCMFTHVYVRGWG